MPIYRASITTAGLMASQLYDLTKEDEADPRTVLLIEAGWLVPEPSEESAVQAPKGRRTRQGVPEIPE